MRVRREAGQLTGRLTLAEARHRFTEPMLRALRCSLHMHPVSELAEVRRAFDQFVPTAADFTSLELLCACYRRNTEGICLYQKLPKGTFDLSADADLWFEKIDPVLHPEAYIRGFWREVSNRELARRTGVGQSTVRRRLELWRLRRASSSSSTPPAP